MALLLRDSEVVPNVLLSSLVDSKMGPILMELVVELVVVPVLVLVLVSATMKMVPILSQMVLVLMFVLILILHLLVLVPPLVGEDQMKMEPISAELVLM